MSLRNAPRILLLAAGPLLLTAAAAAEPQVVVSIKPIHSLVAGVMQGVGAPVLLLSGASSPHDYSLRPSRCPRARRRRRRVLGRRGPREVSRQAARRARRRRPDRGAERGRRRRPAADPRRRHLEGRTPMASMPRSTSMPTGAHAEEHEARHAEHDMHAWLDPHNAAAMVAAIVSALGAIDPGNAARYEANGRRAAGAARGARPGAARPAGAGRRPAVRGVPRCLPVFRATLRPERGRLDHGRSAAPARARSG